MPDYSDVEQVFEVVNQARAKESLKTGFPIPPVADDEKAECYRWVNGQELQHIVNTPGFDILMAKLSGYMDEGIKTLLTATVPTDREAVLANYSIAYAACEIFNRLKGDINVDLEAAKTLPEIVKQGVHLSRGTPVDASSLTTKS